MSNNKPLLINRYDPKMIPGRVLSDDTIAGCIGEHMVRHPFRCANGDRRFYIDWFTGVRCPVGLLFDSKLYMAWSPIPNDEGRRQHWHEAVEGSSIFSPEVQQLITESIGWLPNVEMLYDFQQIHDNHSPHLWVPELAKVQRKWLQ